MKPVSNRIRGQGWILTQHDVLNQVVSEIRVKVLDLRIEILRSGRVSWIENAIHEAIHKNNDGS